MFCASEEVDYNPQKLVVNKIVDEKILCLLQETNSVTTPGNFQHLTIYILM